VKKELNDCSNSGALLRFEQIQPHTHGVEAEEDESGQRIPSNFLKKKSGEI